MQRISIPTLDLVDTTTLAREHLDDLESLFWAIRMLASNGNLPPEATRSHLVRLAGMGEMADSEAASTFADQADALEVQS
ncbi:hypothetical protein [Halomonas sp.]|uniref:hypothetical protein n=1 Tax=Halomonas sp. TaxID=1486246 RepID=UPI002610B9CD|nr:hypothetical protein [Halomonas sp.]